jgi:type IV pilus assembly protein PilY1
MTMKPLLQIAASLLSLGTLLAGTASAATALAELPLKASILAKPNVIFGMDDSGSMDSEVMFYNNDGALWWNYTLASGWGVDPTHPTPALRTKKSTWFNPAGAADATWRKFIYLFPNNTSTGNRVYGDSSYDHFAIPPTRQFAFTRWSGIYRDATGTYKTPSTDPSVSAVHNPLYYNPLITYEPWAPAYLSTGEVKPVNAAAASVKSHPIYGTGTFNLTVATALSTATNTVFTAMPGMRIPAGSRKQVCSSTNAACGAWTDVTADENAASTGVTRVAMAYHPATYWVKESCTPEDVSQVTDTCTTAPDDSTLKRYEIKSTTSTYPGGRTYDLELQNFANWFQYHRKRKMMLSGAMGETLETLTGMRLGIAPFNSLPASVTMYDADATASASNRMRVAGIVYESNGSGGTPTRETLRHIGEQFKRTDKTGSSFNMIQYACQRNNAFIVTDGFANASTVSLPAWDSGKSASTYGSGAPYATTHAGSLADLALRYFTNNPRPGLTAGALQATPDDPNTNLHMNTYALSIGARGTLFFGEDSVRPTDPAAWPVPNLNRSPTSVDDLWHATINGRGKMYLSTTPTETATRIREGLDDILSQVSTQGGIAVSSINLVRGDGRAYVATYDPAGWSGNFEAVPVNRDTGVLGKTADWSAGALLKARDWNTRVIATWSGTAGVAFNEDNAGPVINPTGAYGSNAAVVNYLRGDRSNEGTLYRKRKSLIGAIINSEPAIDRDTGVVYVASGDGMLHAFDILAANAGKELWGYVPGLVLPTLGESLERTYAFGTKLDGTPVVGKVHSTGGKLLVAPTGVAGRGYYAIDVTSPRGLSESQVAANVKWEFPSDKDTAATKLKVGQALGRPLIVRTSASESAVLVTSGYNSTYDGKGRLFVLDAVTGLILREYVTPDGSTTNEAGLVHMTPFGESDGSVRYVYGGDLLGNVWRIDLGLEPGTTGAVTKIAQLRGPTGLVQPVTSAPELMAYKGQRVVYIGTGRLLDLSDFGSTNVQSFYAIADGATLSNARDSLVAQTYNPSGKGSLSSNVVNWGSSRGWYVDLPTGEQANTRPSIAYGAIAFVTNKSGAADCSSSSKLYVIDVATGSKFAGSDYVSSTLSETSNSSAVTLLLTRGTKKVVGVTRRYNDGASDLRDIAAGFVIPAGKSSWFEIRR